MKKIITYHRFSRLSKSCHWIAWPHSRTGRRIHPLLWEWSKLHSTR